MDRLVPSLLVILLLSICEIDGNSYDPHMYPRAGPFFEGWYIRLTDDVNSRSLAVLFGLVLPGKSGSNGKPAMISFLRTEKDNYLHQYNYFPAAQDIEVYVKDRQPVTDDPIFAAPADFTWGTRQNGFIHVTDEKTTFNFTIGNVNFHAEIGRPVFWGPKGAGPQSWLTYLPLPLNWYVYSLGSPVSYVMTEKNGENINEWRGTGVAHMEKNWGKSFPRAWFWIEGVRAEDAVSFAGSGGPVDFGPVPVRGHLIGYRNPSKHIALNFRPDNSYMNLDHDGCAGSLNITVWSPLQKLTINISGEKSTFSDCLYGPEATGFTKACTETFNAVAKLTAFKRDLTLGYKKVDEQTINQAALEFGGFYVCEDKCSTEEDLGTPV